MNWNNMTNVTKFSLLHRESAILTQHYFNIIPSLIPHVNWSSNQLVVKYFAVNSIGCIIHCNHITQLDDVTKFTHFPE